jgi:hypothetical protein
LGLRVPLLGRLTILAHRLGVVLWHSETAIVAEAETVLSSHVSLLRGFEIPTDAFNVVTRQDVPVSEFTLSLWVAGARSLQKLLIGRRGLCDGR